MADDREDKRVAEECDDPPCEERAEESGRKDPEGSGSEKRSIVAEFFSSRAALFAGLAGLVALVLLLVLAVFLGGTVFDKTAAIWACAFVVQFLFWLRVSRRTRNLVLAVVFGAVCLAFVALYVLELTGVLP